MKEVLREGLVLPHGGIPNGREEGPRKRLAEKQLQEQGGGSGLEELSTTIVAVQQ